MEFIAFIVTVLVGFVAESLLGNWLNWTGVGAVFAAAAEAAFMLRALRRKEAPAETQSDAQSPGGSRRGKKMIFWCREAEKRMSRFGGALRAVTPYTPGEPRGVETLIKLNTNENPYPPSPKVLEALNGRAAENLRLYSDPACADFLAALAETFGVGRDQVFAGNGSDEVLAFAFLAFCEKGAAFADITYGFYPVFAQLFGIAAQEVPLREDFSVNTGDYAGVPGTVFLANPNAPTGLCLPLAEIEALLRQDPDRLVVVDEACVDFGGESAAPAGPVRQSAGGGHLFQKRSFAGARVGLCRAARRSSRDLNTVKFSFNPYNINRLTLLAGEAALADAPYFARCCTQVAAVRDETAQALLRVGLHSDRQQKQTFCSRAHPAVSGGEYYAALRQSSILVWHFTLPRIENWVRITVGTAAQMQRLVDVTKQILDARHSAAR